MWILEETEKSQKLTDEMEAIWQKQLSKYNNKSATSKKQSSENIEMVFKNIKIKMFSKFINYLNPDSSQNKIMRNQRRKMARHLWPHAF